jgi:phenylalanyl-tRNA synthetase alpha chain
MEEDAGIVKDGSHEAKVYEAVRKALDGLKITELAASLVIAHVGLRARTELCRVSWVRRSPLLCVYYRNVHHDET